MMDSIQEVKPTTEILPRPKCQVDGCENNALVLVAGKWVCGDCAQKKSDEINAKVWS